MDNYWIIRALFGREAASKYLDFRLFTLIIIGVFALIVAAISGAIYLATCLWNQIAIEIQYRQKYGAAWKEEFEHYYGSLAHAQIRLLIVFLCLVALASILGWIGWRVHKSHKHQRQNDAA